MPPRLELHADFDRDGVLSQSADERAARLSYPGLVVVPNLDRDQRTLSTSVGAVTSSASVEDDARSDFDVLTAFARDDEQVPVRIRVLPGGGPGPGETLVAQIAGLMHTRVRLCDSTGILVPHRLGRPEVYVLPAVPASGVLELTLQVRTVAGASFGQLTGLDTAYRPTVIEDHRFVLVVGYERADGAVVEEDRGHVSVAPFVLDDCLAPATRVYVASVPDNLPSLTDLRRVTDAARVPLVVVPESVNAGDAWLQDQFQHAHLEGPDRFRELVVHLPRLASNTGFGGDTANLRSFVDSHFRSRDLGVYAGLWTRELPVRTATGGVARFTPVTLTEILTAVSAIDEIPRLMLQVGSLIGGASVTFTEDWIETVVALPGNLRAMAEAAAKAKAAVTTTRREQEIDGLLAELRRRTGVATAGVAVSGSAAARVVTLPVGGSPASFSVDIARKLVARAAQMHGSAVYGGNLESTPPVAGAPLGKIVLGNRRLADGSEFMDPDLLRLLVAQRRQPIVEIDTTWLDVGHVDEMLAVVPHATSGFSVLHASSAMALALLRAATAWHQSGLPEGHPSGDLRRPSGVLPRLMNEGPHPVTRMFRGKMWKHLVGSGRPGGPATDVAPPRTFEVLTNEFGKANAINVHPIGLVHGPGERYYRADITPAEILWCERDSAGNSTQAVVDSAVLEPSRQLLARELGAPVLPLPVLFDRIPDLAAYQPDPEPDAYRSPTSAFSPDCANLQVIGTHLAVPKPYGPRMRRDDAIEVVRSVMEGVPGLESARARVGTRLVSARSMTAETYWVQRRPVVYETSPSGLILRGLGGMSTLADLVDVFKDSFPGESSEAVGRRIQRSNPGAVDSSGSLRADFTRIRIDDGMVDLFELFIAAVVDQLGVTLHFVDTWYYHVHLGQIHCGTNVLRRPTRAGRPRIWDVPDWVGFRAQSVTFDDDEV